MNHTLAIIIDIILLLVLTTAFAAIGIAVNLFVEKIGNAFARWLLYTSAFALVVAVSISLTLFLVQAINANENSLAELIWIYCLLSYFYGFFILHEKRIAKNPKQSVLIWVAAGVAVTIYLGFSITMLWASFCALIGVGTRLLVGRIGNESVRMLLYILTCFVGFASVSLVGVTMQMASGITVLTMMGLLGYGFGFWGAHTKLRPKPREESSA